MILGVVALERALEAARWVILNRDDAGALLNAATSLGDFADELEVLWLAVKARRDRIAHFQSYLTRTGEHGIWVTRAGLRVTGVTGAFSLTTGLMWCSLIEAWLDALDRVPFKSAERGRIPSKLDRADMPDWMR
jgi:hypothetical protein